MRRINALKEYLEATTRRYNDGETIEVEFGNQPHVEYDSTGTPTIYVSPNVKEWLGRDIDEVQELRCIIDDTSHEVEHPKRTPKNSKREFMEAYPQCPKVAGRVWNMFEDVYIDKKRTDEWKGLRKARAFIIDRVMENHHRHGKISSADSREEAMLEGMFQVTHAGYAKGISEIEDDDVRQFLAWVRLQTEKLRSIGGIDEQDNIANQEIPGDGYYEVREELFHQVMEKYLSLIDMPEKAENAAEEMDTMSGELPDTDSLNYQETPENEKQEDRDEPRGESSENENGDEDEDADEENTGDSSSDKNEDETDGDESEGETGSGETGEEEDDVETENSVGVGMGDEDIDEEEPKPEATGMFSSLSDDDDGEEDQIEGGNSSMSLGEGESSSDGVSESEDGFAPRDQATPTGDDVGDAEVMDQIEAMEEMEDTRESGEWVGVAEEMDYTDPGTRFKDRYTDIQRKKDRDSTSTAEKQDKREELINDKGRPEEVYRRLEDSGLAEEIEEAFSELKTRDEWVPARRGQRVNLRRATRRAAGDFSEDNLYDHKRRAEIGDRSVSVALDLSSSMPETDAKVALAALQKAVDIIGDQFTACGYKTFTPSGTSYSIVNTPLITAPSEDFQPEHLNAVWASGKTPMASGIIEASRLLEECTKSEDVLIVITDGAPNITSEGNSRTKNAIEECVQRVRELKRDGVRVIGMGVGNVRKSQMEQIFNDQYVITTMDNFAEKLVEVYYEQMDVIY